MRPTFILVAVLAGSLCQAAVITLNNQGFESGNTSGWTMTGTVSASGTTTIDSWTVSPAGSYMAVLSSDGVSVTPDLESFFDLTNGALSGALPPGTATNGSGIYQDFSGNAGDTVTMYWAYVATDYEDFNDPAFALVLNTDNEDFEVTVLASIWSGGITVGDYGATGWHAFTYTLPVSGNYRLGFGVVNTGDDAVEGYLMLDNAPGTLSGGEIPEPGTLALMGAGLLGLGFLRRR